MRLMIPYGYPYVPSSLSKSGGLAERIRIPWIPSVNFIAISPRFHQPKSYFTISILTSPSQKKEIPSALWSVYKQLGAVAVQNQTQADSAVLVSYQASALMDDCSSGAGEFAVNLQDGFVRPEADGCPVTGILGKTHCKFLIYLVLIHRAQVKLHVYFSAADAA